MIELYSIHFHSATSEVVLSELFKNSKLRKDEKEPKKMVLHFLNAYCVILCDSNLKLQEIYNAENSINFCDGKSLVWAAKLIYSKSILHIRGLDFLVSLLENEETSKLNIAILGGNPDSRGSTEVVLRNLYPKLRITEFPIPWFETIDEIDIKFLANALERCKVDVCLITVGTPKQDFLAQKVQESCNVDILCVGAALEFLTGMKPKSPVLFSKLGFEWIFRLATEPRRLWRRYIFGIPIFFWISLKLLVKDFGSKNPND